MSVVYDLILFCRIASDSDTILAQC